jgi:hypothetical protein
LKQTGLCLVTRDPRDLKEILEEIKRSSSGLTDEATLQQFGKNVGASRVVTGSIKSVGINKWIINVRVIRTETSVIDAATNQNARILVDISNLSKNLANELAARLQGNPIPDPMKLPSDEITDIFNSRLAINNVTGYSTLGLGIASGVGAVLSFSGANSQFQRAKTLDASDPVAAKAARDAGNSGNLWGYVFVGVAVIGIGVALYFLFNPPQDPLAKPLDSATPSADQQLKGAPEIGASEFSMSLQTP